MEDFSNLNKITLFGKSNPYFSMLMENKFVLCRFTGISGVFIMWDSSVPR